MKLLLVILFSMLVVGNASAEEKEKKKTSFPPIKSGFLVDLDPKGRDGFFYFGLEIASCKTGEHNNLALDFGVASSRVLLGLSYNFLFEGKVGPFIWAGYNIAEDTTAFGVGITILRL